MFQALRRLLLPSVVFQFLFVAAAMAQQTQLRIVVIDGQDALNNTQLSANHDVIVEIRGSDQALIPGAAVTFTYPAQGASGIFPNGMRSVMVTTNADGRAIATSVRPTGGTGTVQLRVTASYMGRTATAVISQTNVAALAPAPKPVPQTPAAASSSTAAPSTAPIGPPAKKPGMSKRTKILLILAIAGGAAAAGAVVATRGGSSGSGSPSTSTPIVITPGTPTVGAPQ